VHMWSGSGTYWASEFLPSVLPMVYLIYEQQAQLPWHAWHALPFLYITQYALDITISRKLNHSLIK